MLDGTRTKDMNESARHPVNIGHLVMGIAFLGLVGVWALIQGDVVGGGDVRWLLPVPWVFAGIAGLLATTITGRRRYATTQGGWVDTREESYYDPEPNRDLDEKLEAAARQREAGPADSSSDGDEDDGTAI
jgi:hypothetical protein